jgi:purine nucleoside phosphorylase
LEKNRVAIIGGTGLEGLFQSVPRTKLKTPYGVVPSIITGAVENRNVILPPRHGINHALPPHRVNYRANVYALHGMGVNRILATNAVGAINPSMKPGDIVGMTSFPEVVLARELQMCYASLCYVSNMAAGMQRRLKAAEVSKISKQTMPKIRKVLFDSVRSLPDERGGTCPCAQGLRDTRLT